MSENAKKSEGLGAGLRSPLAQGPAAPGVKVVAAAERARPQDSGLNFIHAPDNTYEKSHATQLSAVMFDSVPHSGRRFVWAFVLTLVVAACGGLYAFPTARKKIVYRITHVKEDIVGLVRYQKRGANRGRDLEAEGDTPARRKRAFAATAESGGAGLGCKALQASATGGGKLSVAERTHLAECHLLIDDPTGAEEALKPLKAQIAKASEKDLNAMKASDTIADALLIYIQAMARQGRVREADPLVAGRCTKWAQTNTCVAKIMIATERKTIAGDGGAEKLFASRGTLDGKAQARLFLAGAMIAHDAGREQTTDQRFDLALSAAPRDALALRKQIFEAQALDLYHRGETLKLKNLVKRAMGELASIDAGAKLKLKVMDDLSSSKDKSKTVRTLLAREDVTWKARGDFDLIEILGPESIKSRNEEAYISLLKKTAERYGSKYKTSGPIHKKLATWELRALLSQEKYERVHDAVAAYEKTYGPDVVARHIQGIAYMMQDTSQKYQVLAATEFQAAIKLQRSWESMVGLGMALIRAGKSDQVSALIRDLERLITLKGQRYWVDMLKAEWYVAREQYMSALPILNRWAKAEAGYVTPRRLRLQVFQKIGKRAESETEQIALDDLARAARYAGSREGISSPIGIMALAIRPLD